jgi:HEAT repeat protein
MKDASPNAVVSVLSKWSQLTLVDPVSPVVALIKSEDLQVKLAAIQALMGKGADSRVLSALESVILNDPNAAAKSAAVKVLLAAGNRKYEVFALIDKLKSSNPRTVLDAINGLVQSRNAAAGSALVEVLANNSIEIREAALRGLLDLKNEKALLMTLDSPVVADDMKLKVAMGMTGLGNQQSVVKGLSYLVVAGQPGQVIRAAKGLGELKATGGVGALTEVLMDSNAEVRAAAIMALGDIGESKALDALSKVASRPKSAKEGDLATQAAIRILTGLEISEVVKYADHPQVSVRRFALMALSGFVSGGRNKQVLNTLSAKLSDSNLEIQRAAAYALARIQDEGVAVTLLGYAKSPDAQTRAQVAVAMGWSQNPSAVSTLIELLRDSNSDVKLEAAKSVMTQKAHSALEALLNIRKHKKAEVKRAVYGAIVAVALPQDAEKMLPIYSDAVYELDEQVKLYAVEGLAGIQEAQAIRALGNLAEDANESVQMAAVKALGNKMDPTASDILARALFSATSKEMKMVTLDAMATAKQGNLERPLQDFIKGETDPQLVEKANSVYDAILQ